MLLESSVRGQLIAPFAYWREADELCRDEILRVLDRAARDNDFLAQLTHNGSEALRGYALSKEARAALLSGDIRWVESRVGKLRGRRKVWLECRLQQEAW